MLKKVSAIKVRQNLGQVMNDVALKSDEYIVERAGKPLVAIIPVEKYLSMKRARDEFFSMYEELQATVAGGDEEGIAKDVDEAVRATRR
jgi:prevent-host-death family protein